MSTWRWRQRASRDTNSQSCHYFEVQRHPRRLRTEVIVERVVMEMQFTLLCSPNTTILNPFILCSANLLTISNLSFSAPYQLHSRRLQWYIPCRTLNFPNQFQILFFTTPTSNPHNFKVQRPPLHVIQHRRTIGVNFFFPKLLQLRHLFKQQFWQQPF